MDCDGDRARRNRWGKRRRITCVRVLFLLAGALTPRLPDLRAKMYRDRIAASIRGPAYLPGLTSAKRFERFHHGSVAIFHVQFLEDVLQMLIHRARADAEDDSHLPVAPAL